MPTLTIRLTEDERKQIETEADASGLTMGSLMKFHFFEGETKVQKKPSMDTVQLARFIGLVRKIGGNLNQIAKRLNEEDRTLTSTDIQRGIYDTRKSIERLVDEVKK